MTKTMLAQPGQPLYAAGRPGVGPGGASNGPAKVQKGWLSRWTSKNWSRHWFVLKNGSLTYYRGPAAELCSFLDGVLDLSLIKHIEVAQQEELAGHGQPQPAGACQRAALGALGQPVAATEAHFNFSLRMWNGECHVLSAPSAADRQVWLAAISASSDSGCHLAAGQDDETLTDSSSTSSSDSSSSPPAGSHLSASSKARNINNNNYYHHAYQAGANIRHQQTFEAEQSLQHLALRLKSSARRRLEEQELELAVAAAAAASRQQAEQQKMTTSTLIKRDDSNKCRVANTAPAPTATGAARRQTTPTRGPAAEPAAGHSEPAADAKTIASSSHLFTQNSLLCNKFSGQPGAEGAAPSPDDANQADSQADTLNNNNNKHNSSHNSTSQTIVAAPLVGQQKPSQQANCKLHEPTKPADSSETEAAAAVATTKTTTTKTTPTTTTTDNNVQHEMKQASPQSASATTLEMATRRDHQANNKPAGKTHDEPGAPDRRPGCRETLVHLASASVAGGAVVAPGSGALEASACDQLVDVSLDRPGAGSSSADWLQRGPNNALLAANSFSQNLMLIQSSGDMKVISGKLDDAHDESQLISLLSSSSSSSSSSSPADDLLSSEEEEEEEEADDDDHEHEINGPPCERGAGRGQQYKPMVADDDDQDHDHQHEHQRTANGEPGAGLLGSTKGSSRRVNEPGAPSVGGLMRGPASGCSSSALIGHTKKRVTFDLSLPSLRQIRSSSELSSADDSDDSSSLSSASISSDGSASSASSSASESDHHEGPPLDTAPPTTNYDHDHDHQPTARRPLVATTQSELLRLDSSSLLANTRQLAEERRQELRKQLATRIGQLSIGPSGHHQLLEDQSSGELVRKMIARRRQQHQAPPLCNTNHTDAGQAWTSGASIVSAGQLAVADTDVRPTQMEEAGRQHHQAPSSSSGSTSSLCCEERSGEQPQEQMSNQHKQLELRLEQAQSTIGSLELRLSDSFASYTKLELSYKQLQDELIRCDQLHQADLGRLQARIGQLSRELESSELNLVEARDKLAKYEQQLAKTMTLHHQQQLANSTSLFNCLFQQQPQQQQPTNPTTTQTSNNNNNKPIKLQGKQFQSIDQLHHQSPKLLMIHQVRQKLDVKQQNLSLKLLSQSKQIHRKLNELELKLDGIHQANYLGHQMKAPQEQS